MPIYEFRCSSCGATFDVLYRTMRSAQSERPNCPECEGGHVQRLVSQVSLINRVDVGPGHSAYPHTWEQVEAGKPEVLRYWRRRIEREQREELRDPELTLRREDETRRRWEAAHDPDPAARSRSAPGLEHPADADDNHTRAPSHTHHHGWESVRFVRPRASPPPDAESPEHAGGEPPRSQ